MASNKWVTFMLHQERLTKAGEDICLRSGEDETINSCGEELLPGHLRLLHLALSLFGHLSHTLQGNKESHSGGAVQDFWLIGAKGKKKKKKNW